MLPQDPVILLSYVNTQLRDRCPALDVLCEQENADKAALCAKLAEIGFEYNAERNQFV